jgi:hypothetical protein
LGTSALRWKTIPILPDHEIETLCQTAFKEQLPAHFPKGSFGYLPAVSKWFQALSSRPGIFALNHDYLQQFNTATVPLELTTPAQFIRSHAPIALFLTWIQQANSQTKERFYLAQASLDDLPEQLRADLPTPEHIALLGRGDIYAANLWMGLPPTYTPLHRDPNQNLFVQLVGEKKVRLMPPNEGQQLFEKVQAELGRGGDGRIRGAEMMHGKEKELLEKIIWGDEYLEELGEGGYEVQLEGGDGLFVPHGWWHSIKGVGEGVTASVSA